MGDSPPGGISWDHRWRSASDEADLEGPRQFYSHGTLAGMAIGACRQKAPPRRLSSKMAGRLT